MSVPSWARVGAKVVCVSEAGRIIDGFTLEDAPKIGGVYTIEGHEADEDGEVFLYLCEFPLGATNIRNLRPVNTLRVDVRAIKSMLRELPAETRLDRLLELLE
jgi:hypothetical protein